MISQGLLDSLHITYSKHPRIIREGGYFFSI